MSTVEPGSHEHFLQQTLALATQNVQQGGGPFAALIVRQGHVIAQAGNQVTRNHDPTAHAEVQAIRAACQVLQDFQLTGCIVYSSCEPCPMCLGALYWARPTAVYYASTRVDAAAGGFDDEWMYEELLLPPAQRSLPCQHVEIANHTQPFEAWNRLDQAAPY